jgi:hypothetical protein
MFVEGNSYLSLRTGGTERARIDSSGNVGIGTTSPGTRLDVGAGGNLQLSGASTGDQFIKVGAGRSGNGYSFIDLIGDTTYSNGLRIIRTNTGANSSSNIEHRGTGTLALITQEAAPIAFLTSGAERFLISSTGAITSSDLADAVGYKGLPQNQQTSTYTLALADMGDHVYTTAGAFTITIPANATTAFPIGAAITIINEDANKTLAPAAGVTLVLAGTAGATTGNRTLAIGSVATVIKVGTNRWFVSGAGVT